MCSSDLCGEGIAQFTVLHLADRGLQGMGDELGALSVMLQEVISHTRGGFHTDARQTVQRLD